MGLLARSSFVFSAYRKAWDISSSTALLLVGFFLCSPEGPRNIDTVRSKSNQAGSVENSVRNIF